MKNKGTPFVLGWTKSEPDLESAKGVRISALAEIHEGDYKGILAGGVYAGTWGDDNSHPSTGNLEGLCLGAVTHISQNLRGVSVGAVNLVGEELDGVSVGIANQADVNGALAVQIGLYNKIEKNWPLGTVVQIGLYNRIGEQTIPLLNMRGLINWYRGVK